MNRRVVWIYYFFFNYAKNIGFLDILGSLINELRAWTSGPHPALVLISAGNSRRPQKEFSQVFGATEEPAVISLSLQLSGSVNVYLFALGFQCQGTGSHLP